MDHSTSNIQTGNLEESYITVLNLYNRLFDIDKKLSEAVYDLDELTHPRTVRRDLSIYSESIDDNPDHRKGLDRFVEQVIKIEKRLEA
jgi:hypothetical protein